MQTTPLLITDFSEKSNLKAWQIVDDVVMGGMSNGNFTINEEGNGFFYGNISLKNNGGFSSVRCAINTIEILRFSKIVITLKGDGKIYQLRVKDNLQNYYSYVKKIQTSGDWQSVEIPFSEMYPVFRGRKLNKANLSSNTLAQISFLFGNKKEESFQLELKNIYFK